MFVGGFIISIFLAGMFIYAGLDWLGFVFLAIAVVALVYSPLKDKANDSWKDLKKADAFYPEAKFDGYVKGVAKTAAENLNKTKGTETNYKAWLHKTHQMAKNFFSELDGLFK